MNIKFSIKRFVILLPVLFLCFHGLAQESYDQLVVNASSLLKQDKLDEAQAMAQKAIKVEGGRYEAYAIAAKIASKQSNAVQVKGFLGKALELAPAESKDKVKQLSTMLEGANPASQAAAASPHLSGADRIKWNALLLIWQDADKAENDSDRTKLLKEFLEKSGEFASAHPDQAELWIKRGTAAEAVDDATAGREATRQFKRLGLMDSSNPEVHELAEVMVRKGWNDDPRAMLTQILGEVEKASTPEERTQGLREYLSKSAEFAASHLQETNIWLTRAYAAVELNSPILGWQAGQRLKALGMMESDDTNAVKVLSSLERKGWLEDSRPKEDLSGWTGKKLQEAADLGDEEARNKIALDKKEMEEAKIQYEKWKTVPRRTKKVLFFSKSSSFEHSSIRRNEGELSVVEKVLKELGERNNLDFTFSKDGSLFTPENIAKYDAFFFYTTGDLTERGTDGNPPMTPEGKATFLEAICKGKGFIGTHSATDTFHSPGPRYQNDGANADPYIKMIGAEFIVHGAQQAGQMLCVDKKFPGMSAVSADFGPLEEWYSLKNFASDLHVLLVQDTDSMQKAGSNRCYDRPHYPATWAHYYGKGRVFYTSMGHREDMWTNKVFQEVLGGGLDWALGRVEADIKPNIDKVTPQASVLPPRE